MNLSLIMSVISKMAKSLGFIIKDFIKLQKQKLDFKRDRELKSKNAKNVSVKTGNVYGIYV